MQAYFFRRLLLIPPTLFGITILVFAITRFAPGGPMERALMEMQQMNVAGGSSQDGMQQKSLRVMLNASYDLGGGVTLESTTMATR